jgi:dihydropteroate synthase
MDAHQFKNWLACYQRGDANSPLIMGIANVTPDSFSDGCANHTTPQMVEKIMAMISDGADVIDIGGESTRPGARPVSLDEELKRVIPLIQCLRQETNICISVDTYKSEVMKAALDAGADMINDVNGLRCPKALDVVLSYQVPVCVMHMQGTPLTMQEKICEDDDMVGLIDQFFQQQVYQFLNKGIKLENIILDPGIGFGKSFQQNINIIHHLDQFLTHKCPLLLGVSRKSMIGYALNRPVNERLYGSLTLSVLGFLNGAKIFRTHDVLATKDAITMADIVNNLKSH